MAKVVRIVHLILTTKRLKIEEEEMEKQVNVNDGTFDECAYVLKMMIYVLKHL